MPRENLDVAIVQAARISYQKGTEATRGDRGLIRYLMRHWHTTPFEMVEFKFHIKMPIFIARQHMRHRTASVNEMSARYSVVPCEFLTFGGEEFRGQSKTNKQGSDGHVEISDDLFEGLSEYHEIAETIYDGLLQSGVAREQARCHLPQSTFTEFIWKIDLHNLLHYLRLRLDKGAQKEIREYAEEMVRLIEPLCPIVMEAFRDYRLESLSLSRLEIEAIKNGTRKIVGAPGEDREFQEKLERLFT
jgi:thymidylate synthase (FAD)